MIAIGDTLISEDLLENYFSCNLDACKGACCIEGDQGAPLLESEIVEIEKNLNQVLPYLAPEQQERIRKEGFHRVYPDGDLGTHMMDNGACVFITQKDGIYGCGIEQAFYDGKSDFHKPVSCHLYPVRVKTYKEFTSVNYNRWNICSPACTLGKELQMPLYLFVENALVRRFGQEWMDDLKATAEHLKNENQD
ncbi:MAG: DUF3109 family protein [Bacteroidota bacterium]|nr:DUF3109 family protein [Bacteroidota bacterium]MDX5430913.1 DUF3109 family protein [Bacteroidota bacterium]MDX5469660.1 DUF3109 family protein [Bacteroidota bacterium]